MLHELRREEGCQGERAEQHDIPGHHGRAVAHHQGFAEDGVEGPEEGAAGHQQHADHVVDLEVGPLAPEEEDHHEARHRQADPGHLRPGEPLAEQQEGRQGGEDRADHRDQAGDIGADVALRGHHAHPAARHAEQGDQHHRPPVGALDAGELPVAPGEPAEEHGVEAGGQQGAQQEHIDDAQLAQDDAEGDELPAPDERGEE